MKNWIKMICFLLLGSVAFTACINEDDPEEGTVNLQPGDTVPAFSVLMKDGQIVADETLKGTVSLIVFFNTGCPDCQKELPVLQKIYVEYAPKINMICISRAEGATDIAAYWKNNNLTLPYSAQEDRTVYYLFAKSGIPRVYIADKNLIIRNVFTDSPLASYEELANAIKAANL